MGFLCRGKVVETKQRQHHDFETLYLRHITHDKKLGLKGDVQSDLERFLDLMQLLQLGGKLFGLLLQLPPSYSFNLENLESFFQKLSPQFKFAVEFRHLSWPREETWELLKKYKVAYVNVDEPPLPMGFI